MTALSMKSAAPVLWALSLAWSGAWADVSQTLHTRFGPLRLEGDLPARSSVPDLFDELDFQQATQAYLWALPLVSFAQWRHEQREVFGAGNGDLVVYSTYEDKLGILTANATTPYVVGFIDLSESGPVVMEIPAGATAGGISDFWQRSLVDTGLSGPDAGKGGKYLILPPGGKRPEKIGKDYYTVESGTMNIMLGTRLLETDPEKNQALLRAIKLYPYAKRDAPPPARLLSPQGRKWSGAQPGGLEYWQRLHDIIQNEPVAERDRFYMAMLASLGIEKGKAFAPGEMQRRTLIEGALVGELIAKANTFAKRFPNIEHWPDRKWERVLNVDDPSQRLPFHDQLWERSAWFFEAVGNTRGMASQTPGSGQAYLGAYVDKSGAWLDGSRDYKLHIPANPPERQFWSITLYDTGTRCFVDNVQRRADLSSRMELERNADGSIDLHFGPRPAAGREKNWIQTVPGKHWFAYFRLYAPTEAYFDKSWKLGDIEPVSMPPRIAPERPMRS